MPLSFEDVCAVEDVPADRGLAVEANGEFVALFRLPDGTITALDDACPHAGAPLSDGHVEAGGCSGDDGADAAGAAVVCPLHAWRFDCKTGQWCDAPTGKVRAETYAVKVEGGRVLVGVPD